MFALALFLRANVLLFLRAVLVLFALGAVVRGDGGWPAGEVYFDPIVLYFLVGMVIAKVIADAKTRKYIPYAPGVMAVGIAGMMLWPSEDAAAGGYVFRMLVSTSLVLGVVWLEPVTAGRSPRWVLFLGGASYSLYLFYPMIAQAVPEVLSRVGITVGLLSQLGCIISAIVASILIYRFVEAPMARAASASVALYAVAAKAKHSLS